MTDTVNDALYPLSDGWWSFQGFDILIEPFQKNGSDFLIYKHYYPDGSRRCAEGYLVKRKSSINYSFFAVTIGDMRDLWDMPV
jgi:hypothetical protein